MKNTINTFDFKV